MAALSAHLPDDAYENVLPAHVSKFISAVFQKFDVGNSGHIKVPLWMAALKEPVREKFSDYLELLVRRRGLQDAPQQISLNDALMFWSMRYLAALESSSHGKSALWSHRGAIQREFHCAENGTFRSLNGNSQASSRSVWATQTGSRATVAEARIPCNSLQTRDSLESHAKGFKINEVVDPSKPPGEWQRYLFGMLKEGTMTLRGLRIPVSLEAEVDSRLKYVTIGGASTGTKSRRDTRTTGLRNWTKIDDAKTIRITAMYRKVHWLKRKGGVKALRKRNPNYEPNKTRIQDIAAELPLLLSGRNSQCDFKQARRICRKSCMDESSAAFSARVLRIRTDPKVVRALDRWWHQFGYTFTKSQLNTAKSLCHAAGPQAAIFLLKASTRHAIGLVHAASRLVPTNQAGDGVHKAPTPLGRVVRNSPKNTCRKEFMKNNSRNQRNVMDTGRRMALQGNKQARKLASLERQIERLRIQCRDDESMSFNAVPAFERLPFDLYLEIDLKIFNALLGIAPPTLARRSAILDFYHDTSCERQLNSAVNGEKHLLDLDSDETHSCCDSQWVSKNTWLDSLFCIADVWTNTGDPREYVAFLDSLLVHVSEDLGSQTAKQAQHCRQLLYSGYNELDDAVCQGNQPENCTSMKRWPETLGDPNRRSQAWSIGPDKDTVDRVPLLSSKAVKHIPTTSHEHVEAQSNNQTPARPSEFYVTKIAYHSIVEGNVPPHGKESRSMQPGYLGCGKPRHSRSITYKDSYLSTLGIAGKKEKLPRWMQDKAFESLAVNSNLAVGATVDQRRDVTKRLVSQEIFTKYLGQIVMDDHTRQVNRLKHYLTRGKSRPVPTQLPNGRKHKTKNVTSAKLLQRKQAVENDQANTCSPRDAILQELREHLDFLDEFCARRATDDTVEEDEAAQELKLEQSSDEDSNDERSANEQSPDEDSNGERSINEQLGDENSCDERSIGQLSIDNVVDGPDKRSRTREADSSPSNIKAKSSVTRIGLVRNNADSTATEESVLGVPHPRAKESKSTEILWNSTKQLSDPTDTRVVWYPGATTKSNDSTNTLRSRPSTAHPRLRTPPPPCCTISDATISSVTHPKARARPSTAKPRDNKTRLESALNASRMRSLKSTLYIAEMRKHINRNGTNSSATTGKYHNHYQRIERFHSKPRSRQSGSLHLVPRSSLEDVIKLRAGRVME